MEGGGLRVRDRVRARGKERGGGAVGGGGGGEGSYKTVKLHPHGDTSHSNGLWLLIRALSLGLNGGEQHESTVAGKDVCHQALMYVCIVARVREDVTRSFVAQG
jgi:hypothetical protein